jgi:sugar-specific transcriptional regulator TrmB
MEKTSMIQNDEYIQTLMGLGLTLLQAKTYLALAKLEKAELRTISKASNVARQDIYRVMPSLQKLGLAEKIIANPTMYKTVPLKNGLSMLLQQRRKEHAELQKKTKTLLNSFQMNNNETILQEDEPQFIITSEKDLLMERLGKALDSAQTSQDVICSEEGACAGFFYHRQHIKRAIKRGVQIRLITDKTGNAEAIPRDLQELKNFECKYTSAPVPVSILIFDHKEVNIRMSTDMVPSLWSNNSEIVKLSTNYFDEMWKKAQETPNSSQKQKRSTQAKAQNPNSRRLQTIHTQQT